MNPRLLNLLRFLLFGLLLYSAWRSAAQEPEGAATEAAEKWLLAVDEGRYAESWDEAAALFKAAVTRDQWQASLDGARKPLGKLVSRRLKSRKAASSLPGAPDGQYVVIQYQTSFANKQSAVETITPMLEKDGRFRVSGYYIR